jgi:hypothetical protein
MSVHPKRIELKSKILFLLGVGNIARSENAERALVRVGRESGKLFSFLPIAVYHIFKVINKGIHEIHKAKIKNCARCERIFVVFVFCFNIQKLIS